MSIRSNLRSAVCRIWPRDPRPIILMYHRIAVDPVDHWGLSVSPTNFKEQLQVLRRKWNPFPLADFVRNLVAGTLPSNAVAVTFDDGYVDNLTAGKPCLVAADVPATVFLATGYIGRSEEFWWDELSRLILTGQGQLKFDLIINRQIFRLDLADRARVDQQCVVPSVAEARRALLTSVWHAMRRLDNNERGKVMAEIRTKITDRDGSIERGRAMTKEEVRILASDGLVSIGAHTVTHPQLSALERSACQSEIGDSKSDCEALLGAAITGFAYPYGDFDDNARDAVSAAGFAFACSTRHAPATQAADLFALPRMQIYNWDGNTFERVIRSSAGFV